MIKKGNLLSIFLVLLMVSIFCLPVMGASSSYSFVMENDKVDGSRNGVYHYLEASTVKISGTQTFSGGSLPKSSITYYLYRKTILFNDLIGSINAGTGYNVSGNFGSVTKDNYYLQIYRSFDDGWTVTGSGSVSN